MGIYFMTYEYLVQHKMKSLGVEHRSQLSPTVPLLAGASAGIVLWLMVYPIDVIKSYMQTDAIEPSKRTFRGTLDVVRQVYANAGAGGFFRGLVPTLIRVRTLADTGAFRQRCHVPCFRAGSARAVALLVVVAHIYSLRKGGNRLVELRLPRSPVHGERGVGGMGVESAG